MKTLPLTPSAGLVLPALIGGVLFWLPVLVLSRDGDSLPIVAYSVGMPLVTWLLWRVFVADCERIAQRALIPLFALAAAWVLGPPLLAERGASALMGLNPMVTFMLAGYHGSLFGLMGATIVLLLATVYGARHIPPSPESVPPTHDEHGAVNTTLDPRATRPSSGDIS